MNAPDLKPIDSYQTARAEIDAWRGNCIDSFARGERAIISALRAARDSGVEVRISPMAGPRFSEIQSLILRVDATKKQRHAASAALSLWQEVEPKRAFLAHGELTTLLESQGEWHARFDLTRVKANTPVQEQWVLDRLEADKFTEQLKNSFASLTRELGSLRKRL